MFTTLIVFQVLVAIGLIAIVLVQRGPGATMGAAFGAGASGTVFGSRGAGNFLTRTTSWLALAFFGISLTLAVLATHVASEPVDRSVLDESVLAPTVNQPAADPAGAAGIDEVLDEIDAGAPAPAEDAAVEPAAASDDTDTGA
ncbi:MAG: preprotein translocase subunit SecG [Wenzhouxiangellaceae bacterium]|nr:preprotein translocase subunit SecG [Wenzhouxiangellaceae bacterium]